MNRSINIKLASLFLLVLTGCDGFFGFKTKTDFIDVPEYSLRTIAYVPILPVLEGYNNINQMTAGFDQQMYIVDQGAEQVISLDAAGNETGRIRIPGVKAVAQTKTLDLLAIGKLDTTFQNTPYTLPVVYRVIMKNDIYGLAGNPEVRLLKGTLHPFYFKVNFSSDDAKVTYNGITTLLDGSYYVTRTGPRNNPNQIGGPDDNVMLFDKNDKFVTTISVSAAGLGTITDFFKKPYAITSLIQPPQTFQARDVRDFIFTSLDSNNARKVMYIQATETETGLVYELRDMAAENPNEADGFLYTPSRFKRPVGVAYAGDGTNFIFVVDEGRRENKINGDVVEQDSVYQFTNTGYEGVKPPAGSSNATKYVKTSFDGGEGVTNFNRPTAVAYMNKMLFVADSTVEGKSRILRFKLTTDFE